MSLSTAAQRYWHTLKYLKFQQLAGRAWLRLYRPKPELAPSPPLRPSEGTWISPAAREPSLLGEDLFRFMNTSGSLNEIGWNGEKRDALWRYNQHYFDDLNADGAAQRTKWHYKLINRWVDENPPTGGAGWEPYPTSVRIVNWIKWSLSGNQLPTACVHSVAIQARWLRRRLEWHLLGNHLFANAKGLVFAGLFFKGKEAESWLKCGVNILLKQLPEQVLGDGGHFERSTMYHALALEDLLDLLNVSRSYAASNDTAELQVELESRINQMVNWLLTMCHPDGGISFFNDAAFGVAPSVHELLAYADRLKIDPVCRGATTEPSQFIAIKSLDASGYMRIEGPCACALIDAAPVGPDYLPGHAHADTLSFEFSVFCQRVFVNSGTSIYGTGAERLRQRGTPAHNTVTVAGQDSSEIWSGFRVARRAYPEILRLETDPQACTIRCRHNGYKQILNPPVWHEREWQMGRENLTINDQLHPKAASSVHQAEARYHLHPAVRYLPGDSPWSGTLLLEKGQELLIQASAPIAQISSTYHPRFGVTEATNCLILTLQSGAASLSIRWATN